MASLGLEAMAFISFSVQPFQREKGRLITGWIKREKESRESEESTNLAFSLLDFHFRAQANRLAYATQSRDSRATNYDYRYKTPGPGR